ncbi:MAG: tetraacyldisaccharide 4'-kinase [Fibrobacterota bacterium]|nr:tetraacyldisaccharide 4'-kinase [Fibrobacterota bacterium]QQS06192.1 MAG: tetraacyldisaccharide 4'-kinase [Fibrobacterota bacterium]
MYDHSPISMAGRLVVWSWRRISGAHRALRSLRRPQLSPPLLVVGSARSGGTCKTDLVSWIAGEYTHLAVLCHGTGDEDRWLAARHPGRVFVHRDWLKAWRMAQVAGFCAAVCDGGLQDPALDGCPALRLDVEPAPASWRDVHPWGPWREPPGQSRQATAVSVERDLRPRLGLEGEVPSAGLRAACAVARPDVFFADLEALGVRLLERVAFRDHAGFSRDVLERMAREPSAWVVTEKDAARGGLPPGVRVAHRKLDPMPEVRGTIKTLIERISPSKTGSR